MSRVRPGRRRAPVRPVHALSLLLALLFLVDAGLFFFTRRRQAAIEGADALCDTVTAGLGLTDLCVATEARYTRHPAVSDGTVPFMDHPGAIEHFPTGSFWAPPPVPAPPEGR